MSTQPPEPPIRFYKIIAFSFLLITIALLGIIIFITSKKAEVVIYAKEDPKRVNLSVVVNGGESGDTSIPGVVTSTVFVWSEKYQPTGNKKMSAAATGEVIIYNKTNTSQALVKTTRLLTPAGILFRLATATVVPAYGQVTVPVYADQPGSESEIGPSQFTIPGLSEAKQKVIYAESVKPMVGGTKTIGTVSTADLESARENFKAKSREAFLATIAPQLQGQEAVVSVSEQTTHADVAPDTETAEFTVSGTSTMVVVLYKMDDLQNKVLRELDTKVNTEAEKVLNADKKPQVTVSNFSLNNQTANLVVNQELMVTLDANVSKLSKEHFLGKRKEDIQRYVLGLDHVAAVDVKFSPSWISSAPTVPDKVRIIVKNMR